MNNKITIIIFLIVCIVQISLNAQKSNNTTFIQLLENKSDTFVVKFSVDDFSLNNILVNGSEMSIPEFQNSSRILKENAPDLPKITSSVIIPNSARMAVRVVSKKFVQYNNVEIAPSKGNLTRDIDPAIIPYSFGKEYSQNKDFPGKLAELRDPYILRDYRGQTIVFYPFQYNPITKVLTVYTELIVSVEKDGVSSKNIVSKNFTTKPSVEYESIYSSHFLNYKNAKYSPITEIGEMLIICYSSFMSAMQPFVDWKVMSGRQVTMVDVATIGSTALSIRNYINNFYSSHNLAFVLLVGDAAQVPTNSIGSDSDNEYGYISGNDSYPEVLIGRFSAENTGHVQTMVTRTLEYEMNPQNGSWYSKSIGIASSQGPGDDNEMDYEHVRNMQIDLNSYTYTSASEFFDGSQGGLDLSGNPNSTMVGNDINGGGGLILYTGHGSTTSFSTSGFSNNSVNSLTNTSKWPFIWAVACVNGNFKNNTCFAESWLRAEHNDQPTGAIASLMSTINQSWNPPMCGQDEMVDILTESYTGNIKRTFGGISMNGCMQMNDEYGSSGASMTDTWTCFGDPSVIVRTANPQNLTVSHPSTVFIGASQMSVNCNTDGALVALSIGGQLIGTSIVSGGIASVSFAPLISMDTIQVVVTAYNCIPYFGQVSVIPLSGPYISLTANAISDNTGNANGLADYGETIEVLIDLSNIGTQTSGNITVGLSTNNQFVNITDSIEYIAPIGVGGQSGLTSSFTFVVSNQVPDFENADFVLNIQDSYGNTWTTSFNVVLHAPELIVNSHFLDDSSGNSDGIYNPGESIVLGIIIENTGSADAVNVSSLLSSVSPYISISTPNIFIGSLTSQAVDTVLFNTTLSSATPLTSFLDFNFDVFTGLYSGNYQFTEMLGNYCTPTYTNGCGYGDQIDDFILGTINHLSSGCSANAYGDFTNMITDLEIGMYHIVQASANYNNQKLSIWIDLNNDLSFDATEQVLSNLTLSTSGVIYSDSINIPSGTITGIHRLRARVNWNAVCNDPCATYSYGETHDYLVNLINSQGIQLQLPQNFGICANELLELNPIVSGGTPPYSYLWDNGSTASNITDYIVANTQYHLTVTDFAGNSASDSVSISVYPQPFISLGSDTTIYEGQTINLDAGSHISYIWNTGSLSSSITVGQAGIYSVTVTNTLACSNSDEIEIFVQSISQPNWTYTNTGNNHTIFLPVTTTVNINGAGLSFGDCIGVFYDSLGSMKCGGYVVYDGQASTIAAWGEDVGNDGFTNNEEFAFKIWDASEGIEYNAIADFDTINFPNDKFYISNGMSGLTHLEAVTSTIQNISLNVGWNIFSTYLNTTLIDIADFMSQVSSSVIIVKNGLGDVYWPLWGVNNIGLMPVGEGYQVKMSQSEILQVQGTLLAPENNPISINQTWSILAYIRLNPAPMELMLSSIVGNISIVKDETGMVYWPGFGINNIGSMKPGEGYVIKITSPVILTYPAN